MRGRVATLVSVGLGSTLIRGEIILNLLSALLALLFSSAIAFVGWGAGVVWLAAVLWPSPSAATAPARAERSEAPPDAFAVVAESDEVVDRTAPRIAIVLFGLLIVVLGQLTISSEGAPGVIEFLTGPIASVADALRLQALPDSVSALTGLFALAVGAVVYGAATRRMALPDRPRLTIEFRPARAVALSGRLLAIVVPGLALWLFALRAAVGESAGIDPLLLWIVALAFLGAAWRKIDLDRGVRLGLIVERRESYLLLALVILALAVWLLQIDRLPASIWGDEGAYWTFTRDIASGLVQPSAFGMGTYSLPAAGSFYQAIWVGLFGPSIVTWRIGSVVAALASMLPLYFLTRSLLGKRIAFVAIAFFAASPYVLAYGRTGYLYPQSIFPVAAGVALSVGAVQRDSRLYAFLAGLVSSGSFMLYPSARFAIVLCPLVALAFIRMARASTLARLGLVFASAAILAAAPAVAYGLVREPEAFVDKLVENSMANVPFAESVIGRDELLARASFASTRDHQLFYEPSLYVGLALRGEVMTAIGLSRGGLANEHYVVGPLAAPGTLLYVLGLAWCLARARRPAYIVWPIWLFAGTFLLSAIETYPPHASDLLPIAPALSVLAAVGLVGLFDAALGYLRAMDRRVQLGLLVTATGLVCLTGLLTYFVEMPRRYRPNLEMSMFWSALEMPRGSTVIFVRDEAYPAGFEPWGMQNFDTGVAWLPIEPAELDRADLPTACAVDCRIFYTPPYAAATEPRLRQVFGQGSVTAYENEFGETIGYAYSPSDRP